MPIIPYDEGMKAGTPGSANVDRSADEYQPPHIYSKEQIAVPVLAMAAVAIYAYKKWRRWEYTAKASMDIKPLNEETQMPSLEKSGGGLMSETLSKLLIIIWQLGSLATFVKLTFFDGYVYNWWNWIIAIAVNGFLSEIWPIYWFILRPVFGS